VRIGFIGPGRVGSGLSLGLSRRGYAISGLASRRHGDAQSVVDSSELVFVTVPDDAIAAVCESMRWRSGVSVVHCSGAAELAVLDAAKHAGAQVGGFHPLVMFADPEVAARSLPGAAIAVEADQPLFAVLAEMVLALEARLLVVPHGARAAYHAGAHYAAAFACALLAEGVDIWQRIGIAPEHALTALLSLLRGVTDAVAHSGPAQAMAGSVARGDLETVRRHVASLKQMDPALARSYCILALKTVPLALAAGGITPEQAEELRKALTTLGTTP